MRLAGVDYSMTSPAICVHIGDHWDITNCKFFYLTRTKMLMKKWLGGMICGKELPTEFDCEEALEHSFNAGVTGRMPPTDMFWRQSPA